MKYSEEVGFADFADGIDVIELAATKRFEHPRIVALEQHAADVDTPQLGHLTCLATQFLDHKQDSNLAFINARETARKELLKLLKLLKLLEKRDDLGSS